MKSLILYIAFLFSISRCTSQNLVPNPDFEGHVPCNLACCNITKATPWFHNNYPNWGTAYYFNPCINAAYLYFSVPRNLHDTTGYQWPVSGTAYAGFNVYFNQQLNARQYVEVKLTDTLLANHQYCVEFYVNLANASRFGIDAIGACFTSDTLNCTFPSFNCLINASPQVVSPIGVPITDTLNWTKISGVFTAQGNEQYLTIGSFLPDTSLTLGINDSTQAYSSFYYIDDVSVTLCDSSSGIAGVEKEISVTILPNPASNYIKINAAKTPTEISVLDVNGKIILQKQAVTQLDISTLPNGLYFLRLQFKQGEIVYKKIVVQRE